MQTIIIHANCICKERQGVVVQGYVQWIIDDFETAYRKLDFTDSRRANAGGQRSAQGAS